jgi:hypothetical protein
MSYDVHLQRIRDGDLADGGNDLVRAALATHLVRHGEEITHLRTADGDTDGDHDGDSAEVYGLEGTSGFMATHIGGDPVWDLLVQAARAGDLAIMPQSGPACVVALEQVQHLPDGLRETVVLVEDGAHLSRTIEDFTDWQ